jgi:hypothetical protein
MKYYALWHYNCLGSRNAVAISEDPITLMALHEDNIENPASCNHEYKDLIEDVKVAPIECYTYHSEIQALEPYCERDEANDHAFYAFNHIPTAESGDEEVLVYMSKMVHDAWRHHFNCTGGWPSRSSVIPDVYYAEGIINDVDFCTYLMTKK